MKNTCKDLLGVREYKCKHIQAQRRICSLSSLTGDRFQEMQCPLDELSKTSINVRLMAKRMVPFSS